MLSIHHGMNCLIENLVIYPIYLLLHELSHKIFNLCCLFIMVSKAICNLLHRPILCHELYGSSLICTIDLYCVMNYIPWTDKEVLQYHWMILCYAKTCKVCYSCYCHKSTMPWTILWLFISVGSLRLAQIIIFIIQQ